MHYLTFLFSLKAPTKNEQIDMIKNITSNVLPISTEKPAIPFAPSKIANNARQKKVIADLIIVRLTSFLLSTKLLQDKCQNLKLVALLLRLI